MVQVQSFLNARWKMSFQSVLSSEIEKKASLAAHLLFHSLEQIPRSII